MKVKLMFEKYGEIDRRADEHFYASLDPFFFVRMATQFDKNVPHGVQIASEEPTDDLSKKIRQLDAVMSNFEETRLATVRLARYLASETLLLVFLSGYPFGPFAKLSSLLRTDELNNTFASIADKSVPKRFRLHRNDSELSFEEWSDHLICGTYESPFDQSIYDFVADEARFAADRSAINAFKHGRILGGSEKYPFDLKIRNDDGEFHSLFDHNESGISWIEWTEDRKKLEGAFSMKSETTDFLEDKSRIFVSALLVNTMKSIRLAHLRGNDNVTIDLLPKEINRAKHVRKLAFHQHFEIGIKAPT